LKIDLQDGESVRSIQLFPAKDGFDVNLDEEQMHVQVLDVSSNCLSLIIGRNMVSVYHAKSKGKQYLTLHGEVYCFESPFTEDDVRQCQTTAGKSTQSQLILKAPMPGNVLKINVNEGDCVENGQCLAVIEAMKMETGLHSSIKARVKKILAAAGQQVEAGEALIELEPIEESSE